MNDISIEPILIGHGEYGSIHIVKNQLRPTVVKYLFRRHENYQEIFEKECAALMKLKHRNIVEYYGQDLTSSYGLGILLEYCERGSLDKVIFHPNLVYSMGTVIDWGIQIFDVLDYLAKNSSLHRDIKTDNILVTQDYVLKLCDFGCTRINDRTCTASVAGTYRFMAPEVLGISTGNFVSSRASSKNDVYSAGLVFWEIIERSFVYLQYITKDVDGQRLFKQAQFYSDALNNTLVKPPPPTCPERLQTVLERCIEFDYQLRANALEVLTDLKNMQKDFDQYDIRPFFDIDQKILTRPIGFNGSMEKIPVYEKEKTDESMTKLSVSPFSTMSENQEATADLTLLFKKPNEYVNPSVKKGRELFEERYESSSSEAKQEILKSMSTIVQEQINQPYIFDMSLRPKDLKLRSMSKYSAKKFFELILRRDFRAQNEVYITSFHYLAEMSKPSTGYWDLYERLEEVKVLLNQLRLQYSKRIYLRCYFSTTLKEEWLLLERLNRYDPKSKCRFIRKDLSEVREFVGRWLTDEIFILAGEKSFDKLEYLQNVPLDLDVMINGLNNAEYRLEKCFQLQMRSFVPFDLIVKSLTQGLDLPVPGYIFQLRSPPRHQCTCEITCAIKGGFPESIPKEYQITYHECTDPEIVDYIRLYTIMCKVISRIFRRLWTEEAPNIARSLPETEMKILEDPSNIKKSFQFFQFHYHKTDRKLLYLDLPGRHRRRDRVPAIDLNEKMFMYVLVGHRVDPETPMRMTIREFVDIAKLGLVQRTTKV